MSSRTPSTRARGLRAGPVLGEPATIGGSPLPDLHCQVLQTAQSDQSRLDVGTLRGRCRYLHFNVSLSTRIHKPYLSNRRKLLGVVASNVTCLFKPNDVRGLPSLNRQTSLIGRNDLRVSLLDDCSATAVHGDTCGLKLGCTCSFQLEKNRVGIRSPWRSQGAWRHLYSCSTTTHRPLQAHPPPKKKLKHELSDNALHKGRIHKILNSNICGKNAILMRRLIRWSLAAAKPNGRLQERFPHGFASVSQWSRMWTAKACLRSCPEGVPAGRR